MSEENLAIATTPIQVAPQAGEALNNLQAFQDAKVLGIDQAQVDLIRRMYAPTLDNAEMGLYFSFCKGKMLMPGTHVHAIKYSKELKFVISIDGLRLLAERTGKYDGQESPQWCGQDGIWKDVWLTTEPPWAVKIAVWRKDCPHPFPAVIHAKEFAKDQRMWKTMPCHMLAKCAEAIALRRAFPNELGGVYTREEVEQEEIATPAPKLAPNGHIVAPFDTPEDKFLPRELQGKGLTFAQIASDGVIFTDKKGEQHDGHWLIEFWAGAQGHPYQQVSQALIYDGQ